MRAGRGEGGEWRGPRGRLRCVPEAAKHNFPPLLPPGPGSCCRPRRRRRCCCCCSSRCCSSPGSVVGEPLRPARAEGGATEGPDAAAGPAALLSGEAVVFGGWLPARVPWTLAGNFSPRPGRGPGRARAGECGADRPLPSPAAAQLATLMAGARRRCLLHGLLRACSGDRYLLAYWSRKPRARTRELGLRCRDARLPPPFSPVKLELCETTFRERARRDEAFGSTPRCLPPWRKHHVSSPCSIP